MPKLKLPEEFDLNAGAEEYDFNGCGRARLPALLMVRGKENGFALESGYLNFLDLLMVGEIFIYIHKP